MIRSFKLIVGFCLIGLTSAQVSETDRIHDQLFTLTTAKMNSPTLEPVETLTLLKRLQELYMNSDDEISRQRREKVDELIKESEFSSDSCRKPSTSWGQLAKRYENYYNSLTPYLAYTKYQHFGFCQQEFVANLNDNLTRLTKQETDEINQLRALTQDKSCRKIDDPFSIIDHRPLAEAILDYMQQQSGLNLDSLKNKASGKEYLSKEIDQVVGTLCRKVDQTLNTRVKITSFYTGYGYLVEKLDKTSLDWITNTRLCQIYLDRTDDILKDIIDLSTKENKKSLSDRLKGCIHPSKYDFSRKI